MGTISSFANRKPAFAHSPFRMFACSHSSRTRSFVGYRFVFALVLFPAYPPAGVYAEPVCRHTETQHVARTGAEAVGGGMRERLDRGQDPGPIYDATSSSPLIPAC